MGGRKMAKSSGNFARITELAGRGIDPLAFRYLALTSRYRHKLDYTDESLGGAAAALASLRTRLHALGPPPVDGPWAAPEPLHAEPAGERPDGVSRTAPAGPDRAHEPAAQLSTEGRALHDRFVAAVDDDLDLPTALAVAREILRAPLDGDERRWLVLDTDAVLGLDLDRVWDGTDANAHGAADDPDQLPAPVRARLDERAAARAARNFARADALRDELAGLGWDVVDEPGGSRVRSRGSGS
jgi:cysteinyl-tRNA synthetase